MKDTIYALRKSLQNYANGGYVLIGVTILAMIFFLVECPSLSANRKFQSF